jgi:hypothetical protein
MSNRFSNELEAKLKDAGWFDGRKTNQELRMLDFPMHSPGTAFLNEFGGLVIGATLFCHAYDVNRQYPYRDRLATANLPNCLPVAGSWYWCEGSLWLDELGRAYQADDNELAFVGESVEQAMELLVLRKKIPTHYPRWDVLPTPPNPYDHGIVDRKRDKGAQ